MFSYIRKTNKNYHINNLCSEFYQTCSKSFAYGKWNLHKFRKETTTYHLRDFTKNYSAQKWMKEQIDNEKSKIKTEKLSVLLQTEDKQKLKKLNPYFKPNIRQFNKYVRKGAIKKINMNESKDFDDLALRLFAQDHTAQVLENVRKMQENKIFNRKLHEIKEKKLSLKLESRKKENLIENYDHKFLNYQNYNETKINPIKNYNLLNFYPVGRRTIGKSLTEPNEMNTRLLLNENYVVNNKFVEYDNNKKIMANMRIESMLSNKKHNESLQKYLGLENNSSSKNLLENSNNNNSEEHPLLAISKTLNTDSTQLSKDNQQLSASLENYFQPHIDLTSKIQQYEMEVYSEYKKLDLYNKYNKGIVKFGDLTLEENLNYIKFNIQNSKELFKMFKEVTHPDFLKNADNKQIQPMVTSGILQKLSFGYKKEEDIGTLLSLVEYKDLMVFVKNNLHMIDNKNLVDNIWSIGRLHKRNRNFSPQFFQHFLNEVITELNENRVKYLSLEQISYLCEGLDFLKINDRHDESLVVKKEEILCELVCNRINEICNNDALLIDFHPYNLAKILNYFYNINYEKFEVLLDSVALPLKEFINKTSDLMVDQIDKRDLVKLTKAYSWGVIKHNRNNQIYLKTETIGEEDGKVMIDNNSDKNSLEKYDEITHTNGVQCYREILKALSTPILIKAKQLEIYHCSNFLYHYSNAEVNNNLLFRQLQLQLIDKLERVEEFKLDDVLHYTLGISKINTRDTIPNFFSDTLGVIFPNLNEKSNSHRFSILSKFKNRLFEQNNTLHIQNLSLICYAASLMGYADIDFYLPVYHNIILVDKEKGFNLNGVNKDNKIPKMKLEDLGYLMQSLSLLNFNDEFILDYLCDKFVKIIKKAIPDEKINEDGSEAIYSEVNSNLNMNLNNFSISQILSSLVNLSSRKYFKNIKHWRDTVEKIKRHALANFTTEDKHNSISLLWFLSYFENFDEKLFNKLFQIILNKKNDLTKFEYIILNQVTLYNYIKNSYLYSEFNKEFVKKLNTHSINFEEEREQIQNKISKDKYQEHSFVEKIKSVANKNLKTFQSEGYGFNENFVIAESFIIPLFFPKNKLCVLFYDHSERMKDKNINGFNSIKEDILYGLGYKIERIYANECDDLLEDEDKLLELLIKKIK